MITDRGTDLLSFVQNIRLDSELLLPITHYIIDTALKHQIKKKDIRQPISALPSAAANTTRPGHTLLGWWWCCLLRGNCNCLVDVSAVCPHLHIIHPVTTCSLQHCSTAAATHSRGNIHL